MSDTLFAKIINREIEADIVYEDDTVLSFRDIAPQAPVHVLVIPKGPYVTYVHFANEASAEEIVDYTRAIGEVCKMLGVTPGAGDGGYRLIANSGDAGVQEVPHLHVHILGGQVIGRMVSRSA